MNREDKIQVVSALREKFEKAKAVVFTDYRGLNVEELSGLRESLRPDGLDYQVVKNTLARIASDGTSLESAKEMLSGPTGIALGYDDPVLLIKRVLQYSKSNKKLEVKGGVVDGSVCSADELQKISVLPSREVQLAMLAGAMSAPASKLAAALSATITQFGYAMTALRDTKTE